jgi:hypothetical protein
MCIITPIGNQLPCTSRSPLPSLFALPPPPSIAVPQATTKKACSKIMVASLLTHMRLVLCLLIPTTTTIPFLSAASNSGDVVVVPLYSLHEGTLNNAYGRRRCVLIDKARPAPRDVQIAKDNVKSLYQTVWWAFEIPSKNDNEGTRACTMVVNTRRTLLGCSRLGAKVWPSLIVLVALLLRTYDDDPSSTRALLVVEEHPTWSVHVAQRGPCIHSSAKCTLYIRRKHPSNHPNI